MAENEMAQGVAEAVASNLGADVEEHQAAEEVSANEDAGVVSEDDSTGFDPTSPESRHWQSVADRQIAKAKAELEGRLAKLEQQRTAEQLKASRTSQADNRPQLDDLVAFDPQSIPNMPADLVGYFGDDGAARLREWVADAIKSGSRAVLGNVVSANERAAQEYQQATVQQKLTGFIGTLESGQAESFMPLYNQYQSLAESDPDGFIEFAKVKLGIGAKPAATQPQARQNLAGAVQASSTRPTANGRTQPRVPQPKTVRDGVRAAVEQALRRSGG